MRDLAAILATFATWAGVCLIATVRPHLDAVTAMATVAALAITVALTPRSTNPRKDSNA